MGGYNAAFLEELMADPYIAARLARSAPGLVPGTITGAGPGPAAGAPEPDLYSQAPESEPGAERPAPGVVPPSETMVPGKKPGFLSRLKEVMPRAIAAGIAGGATPNVAGGSGVDVLRAMQAGQNELERRDLMNYGLRRQGSLDELNRRHTEAQIGQAESASEENRARAAQYRAVAAGKEVATPEQDLYQKFDKETDPARAEVLWRRLTELKGHPAKTATLDAVKAELVREDADPKTTPERRQQIRETIAMLTPRTTPRPANPTEWSVLLAAAGGDPVKALKMQQERELELRRTASNASSAVEARDRRTKKMIATAQYSNDLMAAERWYSEEKNKLDKTKPEKLVIAPGTDPKSAAALQAADAAEWDKYNAANEELVRALVNLKNQAHQKAQAAYIELDPEKFRPTPGYGSDTMPIERPAEPRATPPSAPVSAPAAPAPAPAPVVPAPAPAIAAARDLIGKTVRLKDGRVVKVKAVNPDGTFVPE